MARLSAFQPVKVQRLGLLEDPNFVLGDAFWEPLPDDAAGIGEDDLV